MNRWLARRGTLIVLALGTLLAIALFQWPGSPAASGWFVHFTGAPPFDERPAGYLTSEVMAAYRRLGAEGLAHYEAYRALDIVFPWLLCGLIGAVLVRIEAAAATPLALLAALADTAENGALYGLLVTRSDPSALLVQWASALTQFKFAAYTLMLLGLLWAGARYLWRQRQLRPIA